VLLATVLSPATAASCGARTALDGPGVDAGSTMSAPADAGVDAPEAGATDGNRGVSVSSIAAGWDYTCALLSDDTARCWGEDDTGQLGSGSVPPAGSGAVPLVGVSSLRSLSAGYTHGCGIGAGNVLECWGDNGLGECGVGGVAMQISPRVVASDYVSVSAGFLYSCGIRSDGSGACWGVDDHGQGGSPSFMNAHTPRTVVGLSGAVAVSANDYVTCARLADGGLSCWGLDLRNASEMSNPTPVVVAGLTQPVTDVAVGSQHACALLADGTVVCWGYGGYGELGLGQGVTWAVMPTPVPGAFPAKAIASGQNHSCSVLVSGAVRCWGNDSLDSMGTFVPSAVPGITTATQLAAGDSHDCALLANGDVVCWGDNGQGQLGDGTTTSSLSPVKVLGLP